MLVLAAPHDRLEVDDVGRRDGRRVHEGGGPSGSQFNRIKKLPKSQIEKYNLLQKLATQSGAYGL